MSRGWWSLDLSPDDDPVARELDRLGDVRAEALRKIDALVASGISKEAAVRLIEDSNRMKRGALTAFLER